MNAGLFALVVALPLLFSTGRLAAQNASLSERWEPEIRAFEQADREHPPKPGAILFIGGSSILNWTSLAADFPSRPVINRGFGGAELADITYFAGRIIVPCRPRMVVLHAGDNDISTRGLTPAQVADAFTAFVKRVRKDLPDTKIVFVSIKPSPERTAIVDDVRAANKKIQKLAAQQNVDFIDVFTPMMTKDGKIRYELFADGVHLNRAGYDLWKSVIGPHLN
jgi:lysophospholipase L1-like esterase